MGVAYAPLGNGFTTAIYAASSSSSTTTAEAKEPAPPAVKKAKHRRSDFDSLWRDEFFWVRYIKDGACIRIRFFFMGHPVQIEFQRKHCI